MVERTFQRYDTDFTVAEIDNRETQYLYTDGSYFYFLDQETFDQYELTKETLGDNPELPQREHDGRNGLLQGFAHQREPAHPR